MAEDKKEEKKKNGKNNIKSDTNSEKNISSKKKKIKKRVKKDENQDLKREIDTKEINPKTMESKIIKNIYFAGEVIDVDALTGGFNLQIAYSSRIFSRNVRRIVK